MSDFPFFHLRTERRVETAGSGRATGARQRRTVLAQLDVSFLVCLECEEFRTLARRTLIAKYFEPHERAELYSLVGLAVPPEDIVAADATRY